MKIGIYGTGEVGQALARGFVKRGDEVMIGSRDSEKARKSAAAVDAKVKGATFAEVGKFGDAMVLATLWSGTKSAIDMAGVDAFKGKVVLDVTNPLVFEPNSPPRLALGHTDSGGEQVQRWLPDAKVVKVYNTVGNKHMVDPQFPGGPPDMFLCGNDEGARATVSKICQDFGWAVIDLGGIEQSRLLEPLCILWVLYGVRTGSWDHAFKLLRK